MANKIKSVTAEVEGPSNKAIFDALGLALCFRFKEARKRLAGTVTLQSRDANDYVVHGIGGGRNGRLYIYPHDVHEDPPAPPPAPTGPTQAEIDAEMNAIASDATVLQGKVTVTGPLKIKRQP
jgi:hypothetical protein